MTYEQARQAINSVREDLEAAYPIRLIGVFGSVVRNEARPDSDVDILAESAPGLSLFKLGAVQLKLQEALGRPVDLVFADSLRPRIRSRVLAELRPL